MAKVTFSGRKGLAQKSDLVRNLMCVYQLNFVLSEIKMALKGNIALYKDKERNAVTKKIVKRTKSIEN